ncbi:hypothetical protein TorRG33x02_060120 [Trema orientale]|uniref:Uncharacterized protein n=1 Tax=Trema orientale TaxID=63057 RepID=A0A2P5FK61_TREOI|nr:hypothetical protein TorRG33x02_060120 [Trema orientale]
MSRKGSEHRDGFESASFIKRYMDTILVRVSGFHAMLCQLSSLSAYYLLVSLSVRP